MHDACTSTVCQLIPDVLFRCPLPFLFVSVFSCRTFTIIRQHRQENITRNGVLWRQQAAEKRITILLIVC